MIHNGTKRCLVPILLVLFAGPTFAAEDKDEKTEKRSVSARVISSVGRGVGIRAEKVPGEFTVPEGCTAKNFKFKFHDPKSKVKLDKLTGSSIYSVTEGQYVSEAAENPDFELPPGKYKFVVGGRPGAYGSLSFDVAPGNAGVGDEKVGPGGSTNVAPDDDTSVVVKDNVPVANLPQNGKLTVVLWVSDRPEYKFHWTHAI